MIGNFEAERDAPTFQLTVDVARHIPQRTGFFLRRFPTLVLRAERASRIFKWIENNFFYRREGATPAHACFAYMVVDDGAAFQLMNQLARTLFDSSFPTAKSRQYRR